MSTQKQAKALQNIVENGGNVSKAMIDAGYSPATAKTPSKLTRSKSFLKVMEQAGITDEKLSEVIKEGLEANKVIVMGKDSGESFVDITPDHPTRHKFLETALKVKGIGKEAEGGNTFIFNKGDVVKSKYVKD